MRVRPPPAALSALGKLLRILAPASRRLGLRVFLVGGAVRDLAGGRLPGEWDLVVLGERAGGARDLADELARRWKWRAPVAFPRFGTYLVEGPAGRVEVSDSSLRTRLSLPPGEPLLRDALARDFTLNALYLDPVAGVGPDGKVGVLDPTGRGRADLGAGVLRTPLSPFLTLADDPVRILRAARFAATRGYRASGALSRAARARSESLAGVAPERSRDEMDRLLTGSRPEAGLSLLARWGALGVLLPEAGAMVGFSQRNPFHYDDLFRHTLKTVLHSPPDPVTRWAALLHDCGKPYCRVETEAGCKYFGHEAEGARLAERALLRLRFSKKRVREVAGLVRLHMVFYEEEWSDRAVRRLAARAGALLPRLLDLLEADSRALRRYGKNTRGAIALRHRVEQVLGAAPPAVSPLSGREIMRALGIGPGPQVGEAKEELARAAGEGDLSPGAAGAREYLFSWWKGPGGRPHRPSPPSRAKRR